MEDLVAKDPVYSRLEELQQRKEDIIPIRAADLTKLTAQTSQGELGADDVPHSNERGTFPWVTCPCLGRVRQRVR